DCCASGSRLRPRTATVWTCKESSAEVDTQCTQPNIAVGPWAYKQLTRVDPHRRCATARGRLIVSSVPNRPTWTDAPPTSRVRLGTARQLLSPGWLPTVFKGKSTCTPAGSATMSEPLRFVPPETVITGWDFSTGGVKCLAFDLTGHTLAQVRL